MYLEKEKQHVARIYIYLRYSQELNSAESMKFEKLCIYEGGTEICRFNDGSYRVVYNDGLIKAVNDCILNFVNRPRGDGLHTLLVDKTAELLLYCEQCDEREDYFSCGYGFELLDIIKLERNIDDEEIFVKVNLMRKEIKLRND